MTYGNTHQKNEIIMKLFQKHIEVVWLFFLIPMIGEAQSPNEANTIVRTETITSTFKLSEQQGIEFLQLPTSTNQTLTDIIWLDKEQIQLKEKTDLSIQYDLKEIAVPLSYQLDFSLYDAKEEVIQPAIWRKKGDFGSLVDNKGSYEFIINDLLESGVYYGQTYRLEVSCQLNGRGLNCNEERPTFDWSFNKRWYYYVPMGAGIVAAITGGVNRKNYESDYEQYIALWNTGSTELEAAPFYQTSIDKQNLNQNLIYIGSGIALISGLGLLYRYWKGHLPKVRLYDKYCKRKDTQRTGIELRPATEGMGVILQF